MNVYEQLAEHFASLFLVLMLSGCGAFERKVEYVPYEVKVPVPVPCAVQVPSEPPWATQDLKRDDDIDVKARALLVERRQRMSYEERLKAAIEGCTP